MSKLSERAMLVSLHIGCWSGMTMDREVTEQVMETHSAEKDAGRYNKRLVASRFLSQVGTKISNARRTHKLLTLPWEDNGSRILSTTGHQVYTEQMRLSRLAVEAAAKEFVAGLPEYVTEAKQRLGTMFDAEDYPDAKAVKGKFYIDVEIKPLPDAGDFRAKLSDASVKAIVADIEQRTNQRIERAMDNIYERIQDVTGKMVERLRAYEPGKPGEQRSKGNFQDSLVYNIKEVADLIPSLNITGDQRLEQLRKELLDDLVEHSPEVLKADAKARKQTAAAADRIFKKVSSILA